MDLPGFWILFAYPTGDPKLEDEIRAASGEGFFVNKYPDMERVRPKMHKLFEVLQEANSKLVKGKQEQEKADKDAEERFNEAAAKKSKRDGRRTADSGATGHEKDA